MKKTSITWENCSLRQWLNGTFYQTAFSSEEQEAVVEQVVANEDNSKNGIEGGNDTRDKVYLLSDSEVGKSEYGFCKDKDLDSLSRQIKVSDYTEVMGIAYSEDHACWWLRSPGDSASDAAYVNGFIICNGVDIDVEWFVCVPALHIDLKSCLWFLENSGSTTMNAPTNPVHHCTEDNLTEWSYVYFGSYPQTEVTGQELTDAVRKATYDANGDTVVDGVKYRRIDDSDATEYIHYRYYKWEKIKWRVLQNDGKTLFVLADYGLDAKKYNDQLANVEWEDCSLREWLNSTFYDTAFSKEEQNAVVQQIVVNEGDSEYGIEGGIDTWDKVYLLSSREWKNPAYGNCEELPKTMTASDYAEIMGVDRDFQENCYLWLRSPGSERNFATFVSNWGVILSDYYQVNEKDIACIPALHIDLDSNLWTMKEGGSGTAPGEFIGGDNSGEWGDGSESGNSKLTVSTPEDQAVKTGERAVFAVNTSGGTSSELTCQWYYAASQTGEGTLIEGANTFIYMLTDTDTSYNGKYYYCIVTDESNSVTSDRAKLTIYSPPTISSVTRIPSTQAVTEGQSVTFSVSVSGGNPASYTYQWYFYTLKDSKNHKKTKEATSPTYRIAKVVANQDDDFFNTHYYYCVVSNGFYKVIPEYASMLQVRKVLKTQKIKASSVTKEYGSKPFSLNVRTTGNGKLSYKSSNKKIAVVSSSGKVTVKNYGTATVTIQASKTTAYKVATKKITVKVVPKTATLTKATSSDYKKLSLNWKKDKTVTGYEINLSLKKNFKSHTVKRNYKASKSSTTLVGVRSGKNYYVRIRSYKKVGKSKYYSNWSNTKKVKIK